MEGRIRVIVHQAQQTHAEDMSELGITKPTSKGRELIRPDAEAEEKAEESPYIREGHFRLMDLPAELRVYIYEYLLPYNMDIRFEVKMGDSWLGQYSATRHLALTDPPEWRVEVTSKQPKRKPEPVPEPVRGPRGMRFARFSQWPPQNHPVGATSNKTSNGLQTQLFLVNKAVSTEAKSVLYGSNTYHFTISSTAHHPVSLRSPQIFGPFGEQDRLPLLRNLRSIYIEVILNDNSHWGVKRQRARLEYFIEILKQNADDDNKKSLLQELKVTMSDRVTKTWHNRCSRPPHQLDKEKYIFGLESLVGLRGIKDVEVTGVPDWYAQCLQLCVEGKGGEVKETDWPKVQAKKGKAWSKKLVSTRQWWQPMLNWKEFAEQNRVECPKDIEKYWMDEA